MTAGLPGASSGTSAGTGFASPFGASPAPPRRPRGIPPLPLLTLINFFNYLDRQVVYGMSSWLRRCKRCSCSGSSYSATRPRRRWSG
jgi:hypothetical protein